MPRYFFHLLHPDRDAVYDEEGLVFEDDATAKREGMLSLGEHLAYTSRIVTEPFAVSVQIVREGEGVLELLTGHIRFPLRP